MDERIDSIAVVPTSETVAALMLAGGVLGSRPPIADLCEPQEPAIDALVLLWRGVVAVAGIDRLCRVMDGAPPLRATKEYALMLAREAERLGVGSVVLLDDKREVIRVPTPPVVEHRTTPAEVLTRDHLAPRNWSVAQLAFAMRPLVVDMRRLARLVDGRDPITKHMARRLATALDTTEAYWVDLQTAYDTGTL